MSFSCRAFASRAAGLLMMLVTTTPAAAADDLLGTTEELQSVASGRVLVGEAPCAGCGVSAYEPTLDLAYAAVTDGTGAFQVVGLVPGQYIFVADGPNSEFSLSVDSVGTQVIGPFTVMEGYNLTGLALQAPYWIESERSEAAFEVNCGPTPTPLVFNGEVVTTFTRIDTQVADEDRIRCTREAPNALACTRPFVPRTLAHVQCLDTTIRVTPWDLETRLSIHGRSYAGFMPEPPPAVICAQLTGPSPPKCGPAGLPYVSYNGAVVHECAHRVGDEKYSHRQWQAFLTEVTTIQDDLRYCGLVGACNCESQVIKDRLARALARLKGKLAWRFYAHTTEEIEAEPEALECAYYTALCRR